MSDCTGTISQLFIYPIKSCAGIELNESVLKRTGLSMDREWVIIDQFGQFITQRQSPHMAWIKPSLNEHTLSLSCPTQAPIDIALNYRGKSLSTTVWRDTLMADDMGDEVALWLDNFLQIPGRHFRLVRFSPTAQRLSSSDWTGDIEAPNMFSDGYACLVVSQSALDEFNQRLTQQGFDPVAMDRFRPNIVLSGLHAHAEDHLDTLSFEVKATSDSDPQLKLVKPCPRCAIPNINPFTTQITPEINETLGTDRRLPMLDNAICFGMNAIVRHIGVGYLKREMPFRADYKM